MERRDKHPVRRLLLACVTILMALILSAAGYVLYLNVNYTRIADGVEVPNEGATPPSASVSTGATYTALAYNVGFGAYTPDFVLLQEVDEDSTRSYHVN